MVRQYLASIRPNEFAAQLEPRQPTTPLHKRIAVIDSLLNSLTVAIDDLQVLEMPPLQEGFDFYDEVRRFEITLIKKALRVTGGSQVKAAKLLKLKATTLSAKIKNYQLAHEC